MSIPRTTALTSSKPEPLTVSSRKGELIMRFVINLTLDGAAFEPDPAPELARILRGIAGRIEAGECDQSKWLGRTWKTILDTNGNDVGRFRLGNKP